MDRKNVKFLFNFNNNNNSSDDEAIEELSKEYSDSSEERPKNRVKEEKNGGVIWEGRRK